MRPMQATPVLSNQDPGAIDKIVSELMAALAAQEARLGLSQLAEKLAGLKASDAQPRAIVSRRLRHRRPGWVWMLLFGCWSIEPGR
jgi:serine/threonine protein kinase HipA of HipAB toxin-antitoxin module